MNNIADSLREFIKQNFLFGQETTFSDSDSFLELGIIDSTGVLELMSFLESEFQIAIEDEELVPENLDSVDNVVRFVSAKRGSIPAPCDAPQGVLDGRQYDGETV